LKTRFIFLTASFPILLSCLALSPLLKVELLPDRSLPSVSVSYSYGGERGNGHQLGDPLLEAAFSRLEGLVKLRSRTGDGNGAITLEMEEEAEMDAVRFEVSTLIRQVYPQLPAG
jgi:multidrug efflux pump subunit AcrB